jgi:excisionase family DNA binding protein
MTTKDANLTVKEAAELIGVSECTLRRMTAMGKIKAVKIGRSVRYRPAEVARVAERGVR